MNRTSGRYAGATLCALAGLLALASCASRPIPQARLSTSAFITAAHTHFWPPASAKKVAIVDIDGVVPEHTEGPVELAPGTHRVRLKCNDIISEQQITFAAGDVYQLGVLAIPEDHRLEGRLQKIRTAGG